MFYSKIGSEVLQIGRVTFNVDSILKSTAAVLVRTFKQGAEHDTWKHFKENLWSP